MSAPPDPLSLESSTDHFRLLADGSRLRLLSLLEQHALSVTELTEITDLAQSRVSTHLSKLRRAGLVEDERLAGAALYRMADDPPELAGQLWRLLRERLDDPQSRLDLEKAQEVIRARKHGKTWAESVAGRMELVYSPGRSWEATARALMALLDLGDVLDLASGDGVFAELIAGRVRSLTCVDISPAVIAAARKRLAGFGQVRFHEGDMHALPFADGSYDHVFAMHALSYSATPERLLREAARVLRPGGRLVVAALKTHRHEETQRAYDHVNLGIAPERLRALLEGAGLKVEECRVGSREPRPPYFEVIAALARKR
jgi:ArsR family transcriptional regulator